VLTGFAVDPQRPRSIRELLVVGNKRSSVAHGAEILRGIKAERRGAARASSCNAITRGTMRLTGILDDLDAVLLRDTGERMHVRHLPMEVDGHRVRRTGGGRGFDLLDAEVVVLGRDIND